MKKFLFTLCLSLAALNTFAGDSLMIGNPLILLYDGEALFSGFWTMNSGDTATDCDTLCTNKCHEYPTCKRGYVYFSATGSISQ